MQMGQPQQLFAVSRAHRNERGRLGFRHRPDALLHQRATSLGKVQVRAAPLLHPKLHEARALELMTDEFTVCLVGPDATHTSRCRQPSPKSSSQYRIPKALSDSPIFTAMSWYSSFSSLNRLLYFRFARSLRVSMSRFAP